MTLLELKDKRAVLMARSQALVDNAKTELRAITEEEQAEIAKILDEAKNLIAEISIKELEAPVKEETVDKEAVIQNKEDRNMNKISLINLINAQLGNRSFTDHEKNVMAQGREIFARNGQGGNGLIIPFQYRADITAADAQSVIFTEKPEIILPLRDKLVLADAGATYININSNLSYPTYSGSSVGWKGEVEAAADGAGEFDEINLSPKKLTAFIDVSNLLLTQNGFDVEMQLQNDLLGALANKLESTILGKEVGTISRPEGLFYTAPTISGTASYANIVAMETAVQTANANYANCKYILSPGASGVLKTTEKSEGTANYILNNGELNGYPVLITNAVATGLQVSTDEYGIVFGDFSELIIANFGAVELVVDKTGQAISGKTRIVINAYFDAKVRKSGAFKTASLK